MADISNFLFPIQKYGQMDCSHWGYINQIGEIVIPTHFSWADEFSEGLARVLKKGLYGFINKSGEFVWRPEEKP